MKIKDGCHICRQIGTVFEPTQLDHLVRKNPTSGLGGDEITRKSLRKDVRKDGLRTAHYEISPTYR